MPASESLNEPLTLVAGATVLVVDRDGEIDPDTWAGLYHHDLRLLSRVAVTLGGRRPDPLAARREGASAAVVVSQLSTTAGGDPAALLLRRWELEGGPRLALEVRAFDRPIRGLRLRVELECDLVPAQKGAVAQRPAPAPWTVDGSLRAGDATHSVVVEASTEATVEPGAVAFVVEAEPGRPWRDELRVRPRARQDEGNPIARPAPRPAPSELRVSTTATRWERGVSSALADLDGLHVDVPEMGLRYLAAGAPWYMALFGRDTLLTSWQSLLAGTETSLHVLRSLARYQGQVVDRATGEQPGRILHELRTGGAEVFGVASGRPYYGTVDAAPLFVMLLAEAHRWGADDGEVAGLLPAARAALDWCDEHGDADGDGYVEYDADPGGLVNLGWKDSADAMVHADGALARAPIALAEVQAYLWAARRGLAELEERLGDPGRAPRLRADADRLRAAFLRDFWLAERGVLAMALDADKRPLAVASSNMGHCLWTGVIDGEVAAAVARRLGEPDLRTAWGLRTLGAEEVAYNPLSYHLGSVWPHDSAIAVAGLRRSGHREQASRLSDGLLAAAEAFGWRLPELFAGLDADDVSLPVPYPGSCSPQAWSAGAPLLLLREALGLDPDVPAGEVRVAASLPDDVELTVTGIPLGGGRLDLRVRGREAEALAVPAGLALHVE